jgi:hypothetical protein
MKSNPYRYLRIVHYEPSPSPRLPTKPWHIQGLWQRKHDDYTSECETEEWVVTGNTEHRVLEVEMFS